MDVMNRWWELMAQKTNDNLAPPMSEWVIGYINGGGSIAVDDSNGERTSPFIPITAGNTYRFSYRIDGAISGWYWAAVCYYNATQQVVGSRIAPGINRSYFDIVSTAPVGASYIRLSVRTYNYDTYPSLSEQ